MAKAINNSKAKLEAFEKANEVLVPVPLSQPTPLINAIAELGNFTPPPPNPPTIAPAVATIPYGYPIIQAQTIESGGLPVQRLETNGLFNLVSSFIKYWSQGGATKFDSTFGIAPGQGYTTGSVLYYADPTNTNNILNGWYTKLNNNVDTTALPNANWKRITGLPVIGSTTTDDTTPDIDTPDAPITVPATSLQFIGATIAADTTDTNKAIVTITQPAPPAANQQLFQQGRLSPSQTDPYSSNTGTTGVRYLYFIPTEQGNFISLYNGSIWIPQTFDSSARIDCNNLSGNYDVYVSTLSTTTVQLTTVAWTNSTTAPNRTRFANGRWVSGNDSTKLLVGSINAGGGVVQSWYGNRSIWNLYNQVELGLLASQATINSDVNVGSAYRWQRVGNLPRNQNNNNTPGQGNFYFLTDPLYKRPLTCIYNGGMYVSSQAEGGQLSGGVVGLVLNIDVPDPGTSTVLLVNFSYGNIQAGAVVSGQWAPLTATYSYQFNNATTTTPAPTKLLPYGLNWVQKLEAGPNSPGIGYFSDNSGLTATYWG